jgi:hypothetical protein
LIFLLFIALGRVDGEGEGGWVGEEVGVKGGEKLHAEKLNWSYGELAVTYWEILMELYGAGWIERSWAFGLEFSVFGFG